MTRVTIVESLLCRQADSWRVKCMFVARTPKGTKFRLVVDCPARAIPKRMPEFVLGYMKNLFPRPSTSSETPLRAVTCKLVEPKEGVPIKAAKALSGMPIDLGIGNEALEGQIRIAKAAV